MSNPEIVLVSPTFKIDGKQINLPEFVRLLGIGQNFNVTVICDILKKNFEVEATNIDALDLIAAIFPFVRITFGRQTPGYSIKKIVHPDDMIKIRSNWQGSGVEEYMPQEEFNALQAEERANWTIVAVHKLLTDE
ncbi:MAG: hypothetical protein UX04_C0003G0004 [Microgenomates group bacterium GW2011_GWF2_45_18]|nr:MAG: hypothetical protein UW18_C0002G0004 [Microgenomates group bacterium GW2011_GWF1_44_10]KKU01732.1 MAG: hypothetical protein UX04_C0003G0004 [Microgenomates group bacterium GW2011_GWF2_45_18]OGJ40045.1 MAG: hypothetical protein A2378_02750 [Candidatus Pacebacteria bacterium RIFOXYB1_FULL_44_10]HAU98968.1 hypothetical protein [Candidatus Paceibacterota bacterium]HAX01076.1 hypothetical protein [Candidatus Paceibacterota bacterium]